MILSPCVSFFFTLVAPPVIGTLLFIVDMPLYGLLLNFPQQRMKLLENLLVGHIEQRAVSGVA
jgi:hypothetical protein